MTRQRTLAALMALFVLTVGALTGQEPKSEGKLKGQLPPNWSKLGLSDEQKQQVYKIRADHKAKAEALESKLRELDKQQRAALEKVLTPAQRSRLREIIESKVPGIEGSKKPDNKGGERNP
jgi:hypothetical protein